MVQLLDRPMSVSPWSKTRDRQQERDIKSRAVLQAAARAFNEKGFHATSLDEIALRLNVTKPTLYYYFKNKDEILFECVREGLAIIREAVEDVSTSGGTALDKLTMAMHRYAEIVTQDFGMCVIRIGEDPLPPESRVRLRALKRRIDLEFRKLIEQGIAEGLIAPCDPKLAAFTLAGAISWIGRWYRADGDLNAEDIAQQSIVILLNGLVRR
jgi:AcrR family transcriptional regulator